jgi:hypothetical protein
VTAGRKGGDSLDAVAARPLIRFTDIRFPLS